MAKIGIIGLKDDREAILSVLHDLGVVQVEPIGKEALQFLTPERGSDTARSVGDALLRFKALKAALPATPAKPRAFQDLDEVLATAKTVSIDAEVGELKREEDRLLTEQKTIADDIELLERFSFYADRLELLQARSIFSFFGEAKTADYDELARAVPGLTDADFMAERHEKTVRFLVVVRREQADAVSRLAQQKGVRLFPVPRLIGRPSEVLPTLKARSAGIEERLGQIRSRLTEIAHDGYPLVASLEEALAIENRKLEVWVRLGASERTFALEGWVAERDRAALESAVAAASGDRTLLYAIATTEEPPTVMSNPNGVRRFEFFIRFYSLPLASEWDPTWVFAIAFPIFFGLMLGDIGYGLIILLFSLWMIAGFPGRQYLPKSIKNFVKLIMPPSAMRSLAYTLVPASLIAIGFGVVFNGFFGPNNPAKGERSIVYLPYQPLIDPLNNLGQLLLLAGYIGLAMVVLGFALGGLKEYFHHHRRGALAKLGGIFFALGIATVGLAMLRHQPYWPPTVALPITLAFVGLFAGLGLLLVGEGPMGFMALIEIISHILSYTRIIGILLASVILAFVIDKIAISEFHSGVVGALIGAVILVGGQIFNLILAVFEPGIQGARLIFVEHFSKFYTGNGRVFRPFGSARTHTESAYGDRLGTRAVAGARRP